MVMQAVDAGMGWVDMCTSLAGLSTRSGPELQGWYRDHLGLGAEYSRTQAARSALQAPPKVAAQASTKSIPWSESDKATMSQVWKATGGHVRATNRAVGRSHDDVRAMRKKLGLADSKAMQAERHKEGKGRFIDPATAMGSANRTRIRLKIAPLKAWLAQEAQRAGAASQLPAATA